MLLALAAPGSAGVRRLTHDKLTDDQPRVNGAGLAVWVADILEEGALDFWDGSTVRQLATGVATSPGPQISENGQVAWQSGSSLFLWDGRQIHPLFASRYAGFQWQMNAVGQVVWQSNDGEAFQIFLWDGTSVRQLSHVTGDNAGPRIAHVSSSNNINPQINRRGQVVWENSGHVYLWDGASVRELTPPGPQTTLPRLPQINDAGWVAWIGGGETGSSFGFSLWDGTALRQINDPSDLFVTGLQLTNSGAVVLASRTNDPRLAVWDGGAVHILTDRFGGYSVNAAGEVAWNTDANLYLWNGSNIRLLDKHIAFDSDLQLNDLGQVIWQVPGPSGRAGYESIARWDGAQIEIISDIPEEYFPGVFGKHEIQVGPTGQVVWVGTVVGASAEVFLYTPPAPGSLELTLSVLSGGRSTIGHVTLPAPAPPGGAVVPLASANPAVAALPPAVTVPAGVTTATFPVTTSPVPRSTSVALAAAYGGQTWTATLVVNRVGIELPGGITQLTSEIGDNAFPRLNDAGQVAWLNTLPSYEQQDLLWTGGPAPTIVTMATERTGPPLWINGLGEVLWQTAVDPITGERLFHWDGHAVQQVADLGPSLYAGSGGEQINDLGQIIWNTWDLDAPNSQLEVGLRFWDGETRRVLAEPPNLRPGSSLNQRGHVAWTGLVGQTAQVFLWDGTTVRPITHGPDSHEVIQINDRDQALCWEGNDRGVTGLVLWDGGTEQFIAPPPGGSAVQPILNNQGWVVWDDNGKINLWDGTAVRQINRVVGFPGGLPGLNDAGEVAWVSGTEGVAQILLWHDGVIGVLITGQPAIADLQLNNAGQVVWIHGDPGGPTRVYLYTPPLALAVNPTPLVGGQPATGTVTLAAPAPAGGTAVRLASQSPAVSVPPAVAIPAGQVSASFPISTTPVPAGARVILTAATANAYRPVVVPMLPEGLSLQPERVRGGQPVTGTIVLPQPAPARGAVVQLASDAAAAQVPAMMTVPAGESVATFPISTTPVSADTIAHLTAAYGDARWTATLTVLSPPILTLAVDSTLSGGLTATGSVTLTDPAPAAGVVVRLTSDNPALAPVPATVTVPEGATQASFSILVPAVGQESTVSIAASAGGVTVAAVLEVVPVHLVSLQVAPVPAAGSGTPALQATVTLSGPAPSAGAAVQLSSDHPELVSFGSSSLVNGDSGLTVPLSVLGVSAPTDVVIAARYGGASLSTVLHLLPAAVGSLALMPDQVPGGLAVHGTVTLDSLSPSAGTIVRLSSDHPEIAAVPAQVTIPNTAVAAAFFPVATQRPAQNTVVRITATAGGQSRSAVLTVYAVSVARLTLSPPTVLGGTPASGRVTLNGPALAGGAVIPLTRRGSGATAPDQVTVPAGATEATFPVTTQTVSFQTTFSLEADYGGSSRSASLQILPLGVVSLTLQPADVTGGQSVTGTVILNFPAGPGGATLTLDSSAPSVASVPASVAVPAGVTSARFPVATRPVAADTAVVIRATLGRSTQPADLRVRAPLLDRVTLEPATIPGGGTVVGRLDLTGPAPAGGVRVTLASGDPDAASVPAFITVPPGASEAEFTITTHPVAATVQIPIGAAAGSVSRGAVLTVLPAPPPAGTG